MTKNEERKKAYEVLVKAKKAMESFADENRIPRPGSTVSIEALALAVGRMTNYSPFKVEEALRCAFHMMKDLDLTVMEEIEDEE